MLGLRFETHSSVVVEDPKRTDIAFFVGYLSRREAVSVPPAVQKWLVSRYDQVHSDLQMHPDPVSFWVDFDLLNVPIPIESWVDFDQLYDWETRPLRTDSDLTVGTYMGAAIRSFFAQGGRKCYVLRVADPEPLLRPAMEELAITSAQIEAERSANLERLVPGVTSGVLDADPTFGANWRGVAHLYGLDDISFLCLPDLADIVGEQLEKLPVEITLSEGPERFVICSDNEPALPEDIAARHYRAPRSSAAGYSAWQEVIRVIGQMLKQHVREVQFVTAIPLPQENFADGAKLLRFLENNGPLANVEARPFVQLVYPWVRTLGSNTLPEQLESPDAVLCGLLARNALTQGTFRSAADLDLGDVYAVEPILTRERLLEQSTKLPNIVLQQRVSVLGPTPTGLRLLSDVTMDEHCYRPANINRLMSLIVRSAKQVGEMVLFESSNEFLWDRIRTGLNELLGKLYTAGAFRGVTSERAFLVRCDRTTMSQFDIDNGRVIAEITFDAAYPIETISVTLNMAEGGQVTVA